MKKLRARILSLLLAASLCAVPASAEGAEMIGDVNCSGRMDVADAVLLARLVAEDQDISITEQGLANADADRSGLIDIDDVTRILQMLAGIVPKEQSELERSLPLFEAALPDVEFRAEGSQIVETGTVNGQTYELTVELNKWAHGTAIEQIVTLSELYWENYPRMYERFHDISEPPAEVTLAIENEGYEVASAGGNFVHLHDQWLNRYSDDYDCITHELAHVIQNGWDGDYLEYSDYIERFADCCRYEYAMKNGYYNDSEWTLQTLNDESTREKSVRFLVWLDYFYSDENNDILRRYMQVCRNGHYPASEWDAAWAEIFADTALDGKGIDEVWQMYAESEFAFCSSYAEKGGVSDLIAQYDIRKRFQ